MKDPSWYASLDRFLDRFSVSGIQGDGETDCGEEYSRGHEFSRTHGEKLAGTSKRSKIAARTEVTNRTFARIDPTETGMPEFCKILDLIFSPIADTVRVSGRLAQLVRAPR